MKKWNYRLVSSTNKPMLLPMHGEEMKRALAKAVRAIGADVRDRTPAIACDGQNRRCADIQYPHGGIHLFKTKAVCLTAGCAGRLGLYIATFRPGLGPGNSGDGFALASEAGAELVNMEYIQASVKIKDYEGPATATSPRRAGPTPWTATATGSSPTAGLRGDSRLVMWKTFAEGRGPVYLKLNHLSEDMIRIIEKVQFGNERTTRGMFHTRRNKDYHDERAVELSMDEPIGSCGGHGLSGILGDRNGATNVPGLYVAGDVDAGLPQSYLGGAFVMGMIIGEQAAAFAANHGQLCMDGLKSWIRKEADMFEAPLHRAKGLPTNMVEYKARARIQYYIKPPKNPAYLEKADWWMNRIREEDLPSIKAVDYHDLMKVHEIRSILLVGEMMAKASLYRTESRWGYQHWRLDMPAKDPAWDGQWVVVRKGADGGIALSRRAVPAPKWNYQDFMDYEYPVLSFDVGKQFQRDPHLKNPPDDPWMKAHLDEEGMGTPRRFMPTTED